MNVNLVVQVVSASVNHTLTLADELTLIKSTGPTAKFCSMYNKMFDNLNCRSQFGNCQASYCQPIKEETFQEQQKRATEGIIYTAGLRNLKGEKIIKTRSKTGFLGFIITHKCF